jgi:hypothetical protein
MKTRTSIVLAAAVLLSGATAAGAAQSGNTASQPNQPMQMQKSTSSSSARPLNPWFSLSAKQRRIAWDEMSKQASHQKAAKSYAEIGDILPGSVKIAPVPSKTASKVPKLRPYDFAMAQHKLLIVNPANRVVAYVIRG